MSFAQLTCSQYFLIWPQIFIATSLEVRNFTMDHCNGLWDELTLHKNNKKTICFIVFTCDSRMLRASLPSSGRLSVRLSVTLVICIKTVQARITKSSLWAAPRSLVYRDKISCHWVQGFPSNEGVEEGYPPKKMSFCRYWLE